MAHFAQVEDGRVTAVMVVDNDKCGGGDFPESEPIGQAYIVELGFTGVWLQTSYNGSFRRRYATHEGFYDADADVFYPQSPGDEWTLDTVTWQWVNPGGSRLPRD